MTTIHTLHTWRHAFISNPCHQPFHSTHKNINTTKIIPIHTQIWNMIQGGERKIQKFIILQFHQNRSKNVLAAIPPTPSSATSTTTVSHSLVTSAKHVNATGRRVEPSETYPLVVLPVRPNVEKQILLHSPIHSHYHTQISWTLLHHSPWLTQLAPTINLQPPPPPPPVVGICHLWQRFILWPHHSLSTSTWMLPVLLLLLLFCLFCLASTLLLLFLLGSITWESERGWNLSILHHNVCFHQTCLVAVLQQHKAWLMMFRVQTWLVLMSLCGVLLSTPLPSLETLIATMSKVVLPLWSQTTGFILRGIVLLNNPMGTCYKCRHGE